MVARSGACAEGCARPVAKRRDGSWERGACLADRWRSRDLVHPRLQRLGQPSLSPSEYVGRGEQLLLEAVDQMQFEGNLGASRLDDGDDHDYLKVKCGCACVAVNGMEGEGWPSFQFTRCGPFEERLEWVWEWA